MVRLTLLSLLLPLSFVYPPIEARFQGMTNLASASWDGECFYPVRDTRFSLSKYRGKWYYLAGTETPFKSAGCICNVHATHSAIGDGEIRIDGECDAGDKHSNKTFDAIAKPDLDHGNVGAYRVDYPEEKNSSCPGPNYVVVDLRDDMAIMASSNFSSVFVLTREPQPAKYLRESWMRRGEVVAGGNKVKLHMLDQSSCKNNKDE
ncbi:hypothetical protein CP532_1081 [Ophiocordyceps camponoti-leonardi (nom. inval.)]|nr:hypothetical protein CP532_1081 [Ophiocordyceps camponoti-leonardi (nom. inval.)]